MRRTLFSASLGLLVAFGAQTAVARMGGGYTAKEKIDNAKSIIHGRVQSIDSRMTKLPDGSEVIVSRVQVDVQETLKGAPMNKAIIEVLGGTINRGTPDELTMATSDMPDISTGDEAVVFLEKDPNFKNAHRIQFGSQGYRKVDPKERTVEGLNLDAIRAQAASAVARGAK